jgi:hypothetical protein
MVNNVAACGYEILTEGGHPRPKHIAQTKVLFPVPLGPMTMFKFGPGKNSADV